MNNKDAYISDMEKFNTEEGRPMIISKEKQKYIKDGRTNKRARDIFRRPAYSNGRA